MSELPIHGSATGPLIEVIPRCGEMVEFRPERHGVTVAALEWGIKEARRIKDWPKLEAAVDFKIEEQRKFYAWWQGAVRGAGQPEKNRPRTRPILSRDDAENLTGMKHQRVSDLGKKLASGDRYRLKLLGAAYHAAMLDDEHDHHDGDEWGTSVEIVERVRAVFDGQIDCDPATNLVAQRIVRATRYYTKEHDGLKQEWRGKTFLNGPYSNLGPWVSKLVSEREAGHVTEAICLTNASVDTAWFRDLADVAAAICFPQGRIKFVDPNGQVPNGSPALPQALTYLGPRPCEFAQAFGSVGFVVDLTRYRVLPHDREGERGRAAGCLSS
jgi:phage N-6-adenine-methyltransferase